MGRVCSSSVLRFNITFPGSNLNIPGQHSGYLILLIENADFNSVFGIFKDFYLKLSSVDTISPALYCVLISDDSSTEFVSAYVADETASINKNALIEFVIIIVGSAINRFICVLLHIQIKPGRAVMLLVLYRLFLNQ